MIAKQNSLLCIHVYLTTALQTKNMCKHWYDTKPTSIVYVGTWSKDKLINCIEYMDTYFTNYEFSTFNRNVIFITTIPESHNEFQKYVSYNYKHLSVSI